MLRATLVLALCASAAAFAPSARTARTTPSMMAIRGMSETTSLVNPTGIPGDTAGATVEVGGKPFDPLGLAVYRDFGELRECEIKNGRVAMLATVRWA